MDFGYLTDLPVRLTFTNTHYLTPMPALRKIAVVINHSKKGAVQVAEELEKVCLSHSVEIKKTDQFPLEDEFLSGCDACFAIGGDGTLLHLMEQARIYRVPVAGVGLGKLGFLATLAPHDLAESLPPVLKGEFEICERSLLEFEDAEGKKFYALNDLVVKSGEGGRLGYFSVFSEDELVADYACDGVIFSTPTGSTAYNLAAGGPIAHPGAHVILMTPISAHTLTSRPLVFPAHITLQLRAEESQTAPLISADGKEAFSEVPRLPLKISVSKDTFPLLEVAGYSHFRVLRNKLKWG